MILMNHLLLSFFSKALCILLKKKENHHPHNQSIKLNSTILMFVFPKSFPRLGDSFNALASCFACTANQRINEATNQPIN